MADVYVTESGEVPFYHPDTGEQVTVPLAAARAYLARGFVSRSPEDVRAELLQQHYGSGSDQLKAALLSGAGALTFGGTTALARSAGVPVERYEQANPDASALGTITGSLASLALPFGPAALAARGAGAAARAGTAGLRTAAAARGAASLSGRALGAVAKGAEVYARGAGGGAALSGAEVGQRVARGEDVSAVDALKAIGAGAALGGGLEVAAAIPGAAIGVARKAIASATEAPASGVGAALGGGAEAAAATGITGKAVASATETPASVALRSVHREAHRLNNEIAGLRVDEEVINTIANRTPGLRRMLDQLEAPVVDAASRTAAFERLAASAVSRREATVVAMLRKAAEEGADISRKVQRSAAMRDVLKRAAPEAADRTMLAEAVGGITKETRAALAAKVDEVLKNAPSYESLSATARRNVTSVQPRLASRLQEWGILRGKVKKLTGHVIGDPGSGALGGLSGAAEAIAGGAASELGWRLLGYPGKILARSKAVREFAGSVASQLALAGPRLGRVAQSVAIPVSARGILDGASDRKGLNPRHTARLEGAREELQTALGSVHAAGSDARAVSELQRGLEVIERARVDDQIARYRAGLGAVMASSAHPAGLMVSLAAGPSVLAATYQAYSGPVIRAAASGATPAAELTAETAPDAASLALDGKATSTRRAPLSLSSQEVAKIGAELARARPDVAGYGVMVAADQTHDVDRTARAADEVSRGVAYLQTIAPRRPEGYRGTWRPDMVETARFTRALDVAIRPASALDALARGDLRREQVEAMRAVHPDIYAATARVLAAELETAGERYSARTREQIDLFLGTERPSSVPALQPSSAGGGAPGGAARPRRLEVASAHQTQLDRLLTR